jgi:hypothetical protein
MNRVNKWNIEKRNVSKQAKTFACQYIDGRASVCLSVFDKKLNNFDEMKGSWWNFQDQSNSVQVIFQWSSQNSQPQGYGCGPQTACY